MPSSIRMLLIGAVLYLAGPLALPGSVDAEPDVASTWVGETGAEPAAAIFGDPAGRALPDSASIGNDAPAGPDIDLWAEFFASPPPTMSASSAPAPQTPAAPPPPTAPKMAAVPSVGLAQPTFRIQQNDHVQRFLEQFQTGYRREVVERWLTRSGRYLPMVLEVFRQKGLPEELVFTAMIESGFNPVAVSRAGAKGLWQFMAPTARRYGLRVDQWLDERLDPEKSTVAAANYLKDLYAIFGSWELSQAAYNAGEMKILRAIEGTGTRDFWSLTRSRLLRDETKNFVPAIHAMTIIGQEPEQYGFTVTPDEPLSYEQITVPRGTSLKHVAGLSGIPLADLVRLNPELRLKQTPPNAPYHLKVPLGSGSALQAGLEREIEQHKNAVASRVADRAKRKGQIGTKKIPPSARIKPRAASASRAPAQGGFR
jgi:membrane-bound lytic murein transglycosylase D